MQRRICVVFAALQVLLVPTTARVLSAHVSETVEFTDSIDGLLGVPGDTHAAPSQLTARSSAVVTSDGVHHRPGTSDSQGNVSEAYVRIQQVTKGRSTFYSSNLFECLKRYGALDLLPVRGSYLLEATTCSRLGDCCTTQS